MDDAGVAREGQASPFLVARSAPPPGLYLPFSPRLTFPTGRVRVALAYQILVGPPYVGPVAEYNSQYVRQGVMTQPGGE